MKLKNYLNNFIITLAYKISTFLRNNSNRLITISHYFSCSKLSKEYLIRRNREKKWYQDAGDTNVLLDFKLDSNSTVIEIGGHRGYFSQNIVCKFGCYVLIYEPLPEFINILRNKFQYNEKIKIFPFALGDSNSRRSIVLNDGGSSLYSIDELSNTINVDVVNIIDEFNKLNFKSIDLVAINIEGAEFEILPLIIDSDIVKKIKAFAIQFHEIDLSSAEKRINLQQKLSRTHIQKINYDWVWEVWILKEL